jgi:transmembrane sensor
MTFQELKKLYERCTSGNCTPEEQKLFEDYCDGFNLSDTPWLQSFGDQEAIEKAVSEDLQKKMRKTDRITVKWFYWSAAAVFMIVTGALIYSSKYLITKENILPDLAAGRNSIKHGRDKAILILSDGRKIALDGSQTGTLSTQNNVVVNKDNAARVIYKKDESKKSNVAQTFNILETPRGGKYALVLSDGTKVWLNAATSLRYPVDFSGDERVVELSGEAYFEVAHHKTKPFKVVSNSQVVEVLGTHFNVNAYPDEDAIKTTLLEGRVKVFSSSSTPSSEKNALIIKPDEQATYKNDRFSKSAVDTEDVMAWKNGFIQFKNADIKYVMRQVARWYDVEVIYRGQITDDTYSGEISRNADLNEVFKVLKLSDINLKVNGRTVTVSP